MDDVIGKTMTNARYIRTAVKIALNPANACSHFVQNISSSQPPIQLLPRSFSWGKRGWDVKMTTRRHLVPK
jgi:hypothetical protein